MLAFNKTWNATQARAIKTAYFPNPSGACDSRFSSWNGIFLGLLGIGSILKDTAGQYVWIQRFIIAGLGIYGKTYRTMNLRVGVSKHSRRCLAWEAFTRPQTRPSRCCCTFSKTDEVSSSDRVCEVLLCKAAVRWLASEAAVSIAELPPCPVNGSNWYKSVVMSIANIVLLTGTHLVACISDSHNTLIIPFLINILRKTRVNRVSPVSVEIWKAQSWGNWIVPMLLC